MIFQEIVLEEEKKTKEEIILIKATTISVNIHIFDKHQCAGVRCKRAICELYIICKMNAARISALWFFIHRAMKEYYCFYFPTRILTEKGWLLFILSVRGIRCISLSFLPPPPLSPPPPPSTLISRDSHHMWKGKVMGGMAALILGRLPADKAKGCGEAWASALLCNKYFHFVCWEWRMVRWKW